MCPLKKTPYTYVYMQIHTEDAYMCVYAYAHPLSINTIKLWLRHRTHSTPEEKLYSQKSLPSPGVARKEAVLTSKESCGFLSHLKIIKHVILMWKKRLKIPFASSSSPYRLFFSFFVCFDVCLCNKDLFKRGRKSGLFNQSGYSFNVLEITLS